MMETGTRKRYCKTHKVEGILALQGCSNGWDGAREEELEEVLERLKFETRLACRAKVGRGPRSSDVVSVGSSSLLAARSVPLVVLVCGRLPETEP